MSAQELLEWAVKVIELNIPASTPHTGRNEWLEEARKFLGVQPAPVPVPVVVKKQPTFAVDVARAISRKMKRAGWQMADRSNPHQWTEGVYVKRVGCSRFVTVDYHWLHPFRPKTPEELTARREKKAAIRKWLTDQGYELQEGTGYVICDRP